MNEFFRRVKELPLVLSKRNRLKKYTREMRDDADTYYTATKKFEEKKAKHKTAEDEALPNEWTRYNIHTLVDAAIHSYVATEEDATTQVDRLAVRDIMSEVARTCARQVGDTLRKEHATDEEIDLSRQSYPVVRSQFGRISHALKLQQKFEAQDVAHVMHETQFESLMPMVAEQLRALGIYVELPNKLDAEETRALIAKVAKGDYFETMVPTMQILGPNIEGTEKERIVNFVTRLMNVGFLAGQGERALSEGTKKRITRDTYASVDDFKLRLYKDTLKKFSKEPNKAYLAFIRVVFEVWKDLYEVRKERP